MKSIREIVEKGQFIGELNCDVSGRELCACESADLCYRGMPGSKVALMPYCDLNDGCKVMNILFVSKLLLNSDKVRDVVIAFSELNHIVSTADFS